MRRRFFVLLGVALVIIACGPTAPPPPPPPPGQTLKALAINGRVRIAPGETEAYEAIGTMSDGTTQVYTSKVLWQTSNSSLLSITATGVATGRTVGDVSVTATTLGIRGTSNVIVVPTGTYRLTGKVLESGFPVSGATVKVTAGQGTGISRGTDVNGDYKLYGVAGPVEIEISKYGYTSLTRSIAVNRDDTLDIPDFAQAGAVPSLSGTYTLTITVASGCQLSPSNAQFPDSARTRTYTAAVTQNGPQLHVVLSGADFLIQNGRGNSFDGRLEPGLLTFTFNGAGPYAYYYAYNSISMPDLAERISTTDYLAYVGKAYPTVSSAGLVGLLSGSAMIFGQSGTVPSVRMSCFSSRHQFALTPQTTAKRIRR